MSLRDFILPSDSNATYALLVTLKNHLIGPSQVGAVLSNGAAAGMLQGHMPQSISSSVRWTSSEASLEADSRKEKGYDEYDTV